MTELLHISMVSLVYIFMISTNFLTGVRVSAVPHKPAEVKFIPPTCGKNQVDQLIHGSIDM